MTPSSASAGKSALIIASIVGALLAARVGTLALSEALATRQPAIAVVLNSSNERARLATAVKAFENDDVASARASAEAGLRANPLSWRSLQLLGAIAEQENEPSRAAALMRQAAVINMRDPVNQAWTLAEAAASKDPVRVIAVIDRVHALQKRFPPGMVQGVSRLLVDDDVLAALATALGANPPWRTDLLRELNQHTGDIIGMTLLYSALAQTPNPPTAGELGRHLNALIGRNRIGEAYALWSASLPPGRRQVPQLLDNADFAHGLSVLPFDWSATENPRANLRVVAEDRRRVLRIVFFGGRAPASQVNRIIALPQGKYVFAGRERAADLRTPRGLVWRIACVSNGLALGQTSPLASDTPWKDFSMRFEVPPDCPFQRLDLALLARAPSEQEIAGTVAYADLSLNAQDDHAGK